MFTRFFLALCSTWLLCGAMLPAASAQSARDTVASRGPAEPAPVAFLAAVGIAPATRPVGPAYVAPVGSATSSPAALVPNDVVVFDPGFTGSTGPESSSGAIFNLSVHNNGTGAENILASTTVGSGVTFSSTTGSESIIGDEIAVSPAGLVYYEAQRTAGSTSYIDVVELTPSTQVRRVISSGDNTSQGSVLAYSGSICYDFSTGTLLISVPNGTATAGIYRVNVTTGARTQVSLDSNAPSGVPVDVYYLSTDPFGNIFYTSFAIGNTNNEPDAIVEVPVTADAAGTYGSRRLVSSNATNFSGYSTAPFNYLTTAQVDNTQSVTLSNGLPSTTEYLLVTDQGDDQSSSDLYRVPVNTGAHTDLITAATDTNAASAPFDLPNSAQIDTTGRIYYEEAHNYSEGNSNNVNTGNVIPAGGRADTILSGVMNLSREIGTFRIVPPPTPTLAAGTASNVAGTTATLNSNVTADGGVPNAGIFQSGFVYALTSANTPPKIGGTGVTQKPILSLTTLPAAQVANLGAISASLTGLTAGTSYTFSAYARDVSGFTYTTPVTFVTAASPAVTTNAATSITGSSATLNGNVTSNGGATLTARGFVYSSTATTPTLGMSGVTNLADSSTSTGTYSDVASGLASGTTYYFRAYATNAGGTAYGSVLTFKTVAAPTANNQTANVAHNTATTVVLTGSDPNNPPQALAYHVTSSPSHGALSGSAQNLSYTPTTGYNGTDSFTFTATNTSGVTSNTATVTLNVARGTPMANDQSVSIPFNTATAIALSASDDDNPALTLTYTVVTTPTHGTLSGTAPNLTYTPNAYYEGSDSLTFQVSNGTNTSNTATVAITVSAGTPTANAQSVNVNFNLPRTITLTGSDPDSPALALNYSIFAAPTHGTLSGLNITAGTVTYTPATNYAGSDSFSFQVSNGTNTSAAATVSLTVIGQPTISSFTPASGPAGTLVTITGTNLQNATGVNFFRNVAGANFTVVSSTQLTVRVPTGATTGTLTVLSGSGSNSSSTKFTVTP